jgi:uncharacterized protein (TIGR03437 family)
MSASGILSGIPTTAGVFKFDVGARDIDDTSTVTSFELQVQPRKLSFETQTLPDATEGTSYSAAVAASGGESPLVFSLLSGAVPPGLVWSAETATISGTPTAAGTFNFVMAVTDHAGASSSREFSIKVTPRNGPSIAAAVNGASFAPGSSPSAWVSIFGAELATGSGDGRLWRADEIIDGRLPDSLDGVSVKIDGRPAAVSFVSPGQLNVQVPDGVAVDAIVAVEVTTSAGRAQGTLQIYSCSAALFANAGPTPSTWYAAAVHASGAYVTRENPALPGEAVMLFGTGFGPTDPLRPSGFLVSPAIVTSPFQTEIAGSPAVIEWGGLTGPGLYQFNVRIPAVAAGDQPVAIEGTNCKTQPAVFLPVGSSGN